MAQVNLWGATYSNVPAITVPSGNGTATFYEESGTLPISTNGLHNVSGYASVNVNVSGGGGGGGFIVDETQDPNGGTIIEITGEPIPFSTIYSGSTAPASTLGVAGDIYIQTA